MTGRRVPGDGVRRARVRASGRDTRERARRCVRRPRAQGRPRRRRRRVLRRRRRRVSSTSGPARRHRRPSLAGGHPGRDHVVDEGHDHAVRPHPRRPRRARPPCAGPRYLPEFAQAGRRPPRCASCSAISQAPSGCRAPTTSWSGAAQAGRTPKRLPPPSPPVNPRGSPGPATATTASPSAGLSGSSSGGSAARAWGRSSKRGGRPAGSGVFHRNPPHLLADRRPRPSNSRSSRARRARCGLSTPASRSGRSVLAGAPGSLFADEQGRPRFAEFHEHAARAGGGNRRAGRHGHGTGAGPHSDAALAGGEGLVSPASVERFRTEQVCGRDAVTGIPTRWAVGYSLEPPALVPGAPPDARPQRRCASGTWAPAARSVSPIRRLVSASASCATTWRTRRSLLMGAGLVDVLYSCLRDKKGGVDVRS